MHGLYVTHLYNKLSFGDIWVYIMTIIILFLKAMSNYGELRCLLFPYLPFLGSAHPFSFILYFGQVSFSKFLRKKTQIRL